jgi:hypothetical protein
LTRFFSFFCVQYPNFAKNLSFVTSYSVQIFC